MYLNNVLTYNYILMTFTHLGTIFYYTIDADSGNNPGKPSKTYFSNYQ